MAFSSLEPFFIGSNNSFKKLLEYKNDLFKDLIPNNKDDALFLLFYTIFFSFL